MLVNFTKMHSLGNDFIVLDLISQPIRLQPSHIPRLADRHLGIGCDQVLLIEPPTTPNSDFFFRAFNHDGNEAEQCGNGIRCAARYVVDSGLVHKTSLLADSLSGVIEINIKGRQLVEVNLGTPRSAIISHLVTPENLITFPTEITTIHAISMGNPHGVCIVNDLANINVKNCGKQLCSLPCFPQQANISFVQIISPNEIKMAVYERGVGPTLACGSAACAAVAVANYLGNIGNQAKVNFKHGFVTVTIDAITKNLHLLGSAISVCMGKFCT